MKIIATMMVMMLLIGVFVFPNVLAQAGTLTVQTDKDSYKIGEDIKISGTVPAVIEGVPVAIQVFNPRNTMYTIDQALPNYDGTYSTVIQVLGGKLGINGIYTIKATYSNQSVQTQFEIIGAQAGALTVQTDKGSYSVGESIRISGTVPAVIEGVPVGISIYNPQNVMYTIDQVTPYSDGTYRTTIQIGGKLGISGTYTVEAIYSNLRVFTYFEIVGANTGGGSIMVQYEGNVFYVDAKLSNGNVYGIEVDPDFISVIVSVSAYDNGDLIITLPRKLIDARYNACSGSDDRFITLINGQEEFYYESSNTSLDRTLSIPVFGGATEIEIIGTCIIGKQKQPQQPVVPSSITVSTDKEYYPAGETIRIFGNVYPVIANVPVSIQVFNPRNEMYTIDSIMPNYSGSYSTSIKVGGKLGIDGIYTIKATYSSITAQTLFDFDGSQQSPSGTVRVEYAGNVFMVKTAVTSGTVHGINVDPDFTSVIISVSASGYGQLTIILPRKLLDARFDNCGGDDDEFIVLLNGKEVRYDETSTSSSDRTLAIGVSSSVREIEIIGTCIIGQNVITPMPPTSSIRRGELDYAIIFLTIWDECTKTNYNALNFYSYLTNQYLNRYGFQSSNPYELCVNSEEFVEKSDRYLRDVGDKDAIIIITNFWTSLDMLLNEYSGNSHIDPNLGSFTPYEGQYLILTKSVTWSQASWTLSHELAHMILYHMGTPRTVYADGVHYIDALYENCEDRLQCGDVYFEILYPVDHEYYELMRIDAFVDAVKYEQPRLEPVSTRQFEPEYSWNTLQTSQPVIEQDGQKTSYLSIGSNVLIKTKVSNSQQDIQKFTLLLQVKDSDGFIASLTMLENATIDRADTSTISLSWIPSERGIYTVEVFVWENVNNPTALAPMNSLQIIVS